MKKVVLIGYMGSGKSAIAKILAEKSRIPFLELDEVIEKKCGMIIKTIFETKGELFFRKMEHELLSELLNNKNNELIISTGGGTPCYFNNHELLNVDNVITIYLQASVATLYERLIGEKLKRPLIAHLKDDEIQEFIAKHLFDRNYYYNQAQYKISVDGKTVDEIVNEILLLLA